MTHIVLSESAKFIHIEKIYCLLTNEENYDEPVSTKNALTVEYLGDRAGGVFRLWKHC